MRYERIVTMLMRTVRSTQMIFALLAAILIALPCAAQDTTARAVKVNRGRIVGVFDDQTGQPIAGVEVRDLANGLSALTTETGTLSLFFVDTSGSFIQIRKVGYRPLTMPVQNSARDTSALTIMLTPVGQSLPGMTITARGRLGPSDTVGVLINSGFYDRRNSGLARESVRFLPGDRIRSLTLVSDVSCAMGLANLYRQSVHRRRQDERPPGAPQRQLPQTGR